MGRGLLLRGTEREGRESPKVKSESRRGKKNRPETEKSRDNTRVSTLLVDYTYASELSMGWVWSRFFSLVGCLGLGSTTKVYASLLGQSAVS